MSALSFFISCLTIGIYSEITVFEKVKGKLQERRENGRNQCFNHCNSSFKQVITEIIGNSMCCMFQESEPMAYKQMMREFELKKRSIQENTKGTVTITLPEELINMCVSEIGEDIESILLQNRYSKVITMTGNILHIEVEFIKRRLESSLEKVSKLMDKLITVNTDVIMIGGYAVNGYVLNSIKRKFSTTRIFIPNEADLVVMKGAVLYGHQLAGQDPHTKYNEVRRRFCFALYLL